MENSVNIQQAAEPKRSLLREKLLLTWRGVIKENPTFVLVLGMCPTLGTTTSATNGLGMGVATMAVLIMSNIVISIIKNVIPDKVRIPAFIVVIASFVTVIQMLMQAYVPSLYAALGVFIPLIVVNCIILGRAEAFASKNGVLDSALDGVGIGLGFTLSLTVIGAVRELLGSGAIFGYSLGIGEYMPLVFVLAPGAFLVLGFLMVLFNKFLKK
ncbi:MAG: electron transport complex subunit E [Alistipes sp.]|jgi:electron transport complex protein RnfE|nr:electron transport complex subunit E [Alistipes sp.]